MSEAYPLILAELLPTQSGLAELKLPDGNITTMDDAPIGTAFELPDGHDALAYWHRLKSAEYERDHAGKRGMYLVKLPNGRWFSPDKHVTPPTGTPADRHGWTVTGTLAHLSVTPSVSMSAGHPGGWHGWIGVNGTPPGHLSRDLDGRNC